MFKKIDIWILYLVIFLNFFLSIFLASFFGILVRQELIGSRKLGKISETALLIAETPLYLKEIFINPHRVKQDRFPNKRGFEGYPNSQESYLLLSRYDGDLKEGVVELIDLRNFKTIYNWNPDIDAFNKNLAKIKDFKNTKRDRNDYRSLIKNPILTKDGGIIFGDLSPLRKIDKCSNLVFQKSEDATHHSKEIDIDGNIWSPTYIYPQTLKASQVGRKTPMKGYLDDGIVKFSAEGEIIFSKSVSQILIDNGLEHLLFTSKELNRFNKDPIHLNDIQPVNFDGEFWKKGDVFLSLRHQSMIILYRPSNNKIIWKLTGPFFHQHDVNILNNHKISIFNNNSKMFASGDYVDGNNEMIIYDFKLKKSYSYLKDSLSKNDVRTITQGRGQILSNGDLFIEENNYGRLLYINSDGLLRWTHVNRAQNGAIFDYGWSRILNTKKDIENIKNLLKSKINFKK